MKLERLFKEMGIEKDNFEDLHIIRFFSSFVAISKEKVIRMTEPFLEYCPLADSLYDNMKGIRKIVEEKIAKFGHFTAERKLYREDVAIPYGASEMMMYALQKKEIDSAVIACDGAGTVIVSKPAVVQGIGARMNGLFYTSPIEEIIKRLERANCHVVFPKTADIDQTSGLEKSVELGYKKISVTVNACMEDLSKVKEVEEKYKVSAISLAVCTTGIDEEKMKEIEEYADLVWSCASAKIRKAGEKAKLQVSTAIPVFVLTEKGLNFITSYSSSEKAFKNLDTEKQYLISGRYKGTKVRMGDFNTYLSEAELPVRSEKEPRPLT